MTGDTRQARRITKLQNIEYPNNRGRLIPENARREVYAQWRSHTQTVMDFLVGVVRDEDKDTGHRIMAGKEILNRGWGQAPNVDVIEATLRVTHELDPAALQQMPQAELDMIMAALGRMMRTPGDGARIIDATPDPNES